MSTLLHPSGYTSLCSHSTQPAGWLTQGPKADHLLTLLCEINTLLVNSLVNPPAG